MYIYIKRIFLITEIVRMNEKTGTSVSSDKEKVKESQSVTKRDTPARHPLRGPGRGHHIYIVVVEVLHQLVQLAQHHQL